MGKRFSSYGDQSSFRLRKLPVMRQMLTDEIKRPDHLRRDNAKQSVMAAWDPYGKMETSTPHSSEPLKL